MGNQSYFPDTNKTNLPFHKLIKKVMTSLEEKKLLV